MERERESDGERGRACHSLDRGRKDSSVVWNRHFKTPTSWLRGKEAPSCFMAITPCWLNWPLSTLGLVCMCVCVCLYICVDVLEIKIMRNEGQTHKLSTTNAPPSPNTLIHAPTLKLV